MKNPRVKDRLQAMEVKPSKQRGQNFLIDSNVIRSLVEFGAPRAEDNIVEIGPGLGALTKELAVFPNLTLVEIEQKFCDELSRQYPNVKVICNDVRSFDFARVGTNLVVFGNLPYVFSTDIVFHLIRHAGVITRAILMLQREFSERLAAPPGGREYGAISVACQMRADVRLGTIIPGNSFHPPTKVESRLVELAFLPKPRFEIDDPKWFERVVRASFSKRRKKLSNSLKSVGYLSEDGVMQALEASGIDGGRRAETLGMSEFVTLAKHLKPALIVTS